jgi:hypothetical protein
MISHLVVQTKVAHYSASGLDSNAEQNTVELVAISNLAGPPLTLT